MNKDEPQRFVGQSVESEYAIEHPLIGKQAQSSNSASALSLFFESVQCQRDGNELRGATLYEEALKTDPSLHTKARNALSNMLQNCNPLDKGAIYYWLGIHSEHLKDEHKALTWYTKAADAFHKIGYQKREARVRSNLGTLKMKLEDPSGIDEYEQAIKLNPLDGIAHINIATAYFITDQHERALDSFADAIWADPNRYAPVVKSRLQRWSYTWKEDLDKIRQRVAQKQGMDLDLLKSGDSESFRQAYHVFEIGNGFFQSKRYKEALEQFEKGKLLANNFPGNFFGVSMTVMQMIEVGAISKDRIPVYLEKADQNIDECLRIIPANLDYQNAKNIIKGYKKKYHVE